ncbi:DinB family protein [Salegentibacter sp. JZCK2]|uniref:DinB family protein n=1 Tax=Salegentibacter tibetensis TaxID=2873600 RepID=UPI001CCD59B4|nr:DinB family protein [Salegentibacter tibetensis]MBZ9729678.1 DinB family protein [Salegentibacter tibetensis]
MKNSFFGITLFLIASLPLAAQQNTNDKDFLLNYFEETTQNLENEISGLSKEQMHFKPSEEQWSVSQCVEHIH